MTLLSRTPKISKACVPCRTRKVKCNAAVVGLPCGSCVSKECPEECVLSARKRRTVKARSTEPHRLRRNQPMGDSSVPTFQPQPQQPSSNISRQTTDSSHLDSLEETIHASHANTSSRNDTPNSRIRHEPGHAQPDLLYLNILQETVNDTSAGHPNSSDHQTDNGPDDSFNTQIHHWNPPPQLDDIDNEYLIKKKVFELPLSRYMDAIVKAYFDYAHPFAPILNRTDFVQSYRAGSYNPFLLHAISTAGSLYVPNEVIAGCGYPDRSAAQMGFFSKAKLFHDFYYQGDELSMLQGSIILSTTILDHHSDKNFQYWFYNSVRRASKLGIHNACLRDGKFQKVYRRIWWVLYNGDVFYAFVNTQNMRLFASAPPIKPLTEDDWEPENLDECSGLLSPVSNTQKASVMAHCELAQISGSIISFLSSSTASAEDVQKLIRQLDLWRSSVPEKMQLPKDFTEGELYHLQVLTTSYRFECIMCRLLRRERLQLRDSDLREWAQQRFRSAIVELDTIIKRVMINHAMQKLPITFITTIIALLALHIESALDSSEPTLIRSMARISIQHTMLALDQIRDIPAIKRALPAFEAVLSKNKLYQWSLEHAEESNTANSVSRDGDYNDQHILPLAQSNMSISQDEETYLFEDFIGLDFLDRWQMDQLDFTGTYQ